MDGVRALAVIAVVTYHLWPAALPGGFIGVDVFFVLSGYLITRSFRVHTGLRVGTRLARFWQHRARRILPPLLPVIVVTAALAGLIGRDVLPNLGAAVLGAITFSSNWVAIIQASSYFAGTSAHPLQHLWSLAVEEQFYVLWPLMLLLIGLLPRQVRPWVPISIAALSATAMAALFVPGSDPTAVYVGTGTHVFGLTLGAALALDEERSVRSSVTVTGRRVVAALVGAGALTMLVVAAFQLTDFGVVAYRGGLAAVSIVTAALIWSLTRGVPGIGRLLNIQPLRALGRRSFAIYLWHWPALTLLTAAVTPRTAATHRTVWVLTVLLTLVAAAASWRWIEQPILRHGWRHTARRIIAARPLPRYAAAATATVLIVGTGAACVASARPSDAQQLITAGQRYLHDHPITPQPTPSTPATDEPNPSTSTPVPSPLPAAGTPNPSSTTMSAAPKPANVTQMNITAVGDSVMLAAAPTLQAALPNASIDAEVSRQPYDVAAILRADAAAGRLADTVLVGIGTNGALGPALPQIRAAIGQHRTLVLLTAHGDRAWIAGVNDTIRSFAAADPNTKIADWDRAISGKEDLLAADGIHPGTAAARIYAQAVVTALRS